MADGKDIALAIFIIIALVAIGVAIFLGVLYFSEKGEKKILLRNMDSMSYRRHGADLLEEQNTQLTAAY